METGWNIRGQTVLVKSQSKHGRKQSGAQGCRGFSVRVRVSIGGSVVERCSRRSTVRVTVSVGGSIVEHKVAASPR
jgi:hypothetical protein